MNKRMSLWRMIVALVVGASLLHLFSLHVLAIIATVVASFLVVRSDLPRRLSSASLPRGAYWAGSDARSLAIVEILLTPRLINHELYKAKLFVNERPVGVARPRELVATTFMDAAIATILARSRKGKHTVNGERLTVPILVSVTRGAVGPIAFFTAIPGATENAYDYAADVLEVSMRVPEIRVEQLPEDRERGVMRMTFVVNDPLRGGVAESFFAMNPVLTPMLLPLALAEDGSVYSLPIHHTLIVGATGSGKGGVLQGTIRQLAPWQDRGLVRIFGADPKRAELRGFDSSSLFEKVAFDLDSIAEMVQAIVTDVLRPRQMVSGRSFNLSTDNPLVLLLVDELSSLTQDRNYAKSGLAENLNLILSQGRSDGVYVFAAAQSGHKEILGSLRQHFANRIALRVDTAIEVDMVLGSGSLDLGAAPHLIAKANESNGYATAGVGYVNSDESQRPLRIRFPFTPDSEIKRLIETYPRVRWNGFLD